MDIYDPRFKAAAGPDQELQVSAPDPDILTVEKGGRVLLRVTSDIEVIAPDIEAASEAGHVFVESLRLNLLLLWGRSHFEASGLGPRLSEPINPLPDPAN